MANNATTTWIWDGTANAWASAHWLDADRQAVDDAPDGALVTHTVVLEGANVPTNGPAFLACAVFDTVEVGAHFQTTITATIAVTATLRMGKTGTTHRHRWCGSTGPACDLLLDGYAYIHTDNAAAGQDADDVAIVSRSISLLGGSHIGAGNGGDDEEAAGDGGSVSLTADSLTADFTAVGLFSRKITGGSGGSSLAAGGAGGNVTITAATVTLTGTISGDMILAGGGGLSDSGNAPAAGTVTITAETLNLAGSARVIGGAGGQGGTSASPGGDVTLDIDGTLTLAGTSYVRGGPGGISYFVPLGAGGSVSIEADTVLVTSSSTGAVSGGTGGGGYTDCAGGAGGDVTILAAAGFTQSNGYVIGGSGGAGGGGEYTGSGAGGSGGDLVISAPSVAITGGRTYGGNGGEGGSSYVYEGAVGGDAGDVTILADRLAVQSNFVSAGQVGQGGYDSMYLQASNGQAGSAQLIARTSRMRARWDAAIPTVLTLDGVDLVSYSGSLVMPGWTASNGSRFLIERPEQAFRIGNVDAAVRTPRGAQQL